jgi:hypothetical protein
MTACGAQLSVGEVAVSALGKAAMAERGKRQFRSNACGRDDVLYDAPQISKSLRSVIQGSGVGDLRCA